MPENPYKIVIDTNIWISYMLNRSQSLLGQILLSEAIDLVSSQALEDELFNVLNRPKFSRRFTLEQIQRFREDFELAVHHIQVSSQVDICRDPKDNFLLALALDANADFILTGDEDLLVLSRFNDIVIITIRDFIDNYFGSLT